MKADEALFRFRYAAHAVVYTLAFAAPWEWRAGYDGSQTTWLTLAGWMTRNGWMSFRAATIGLLTIGTVCAWLGAWLRTWGTAYLGGAVVQGPAMQGAGMVADGPYRHLRNPLYLGTWVHTFALALLMPASGAVFAIVAIGGLQVLLIRGEERFLAAKLGEPYALYAARVPRLLPALRGASDTALARGGARARWAQAVLAEIYMWGVAVSFAALGWQFNGRLLGRCVLVSLGVSLVVRGLVRRSGGDGAGGA